MASGSVTVNKVYNNNVVLGTDPDGKEVVLLGKGLGFGRRPGDTLLDVEGQRFVSDAT